jgi:hypothetical protein
VVLRVDATALALLDGHPVVYDALCAAVSAAMATRADQALLDLRVYWGLAEDGSGATYRAGLRSEVSRDDPTALRAALGAYLRAVGADELADRLASAVVTCSPAPGGYQLVLTTTPAVRTAIESDRGAVAALRSAASSLLRGPESDRVRVRWRP